MASSTATIRTSVRARWCLGAALGGYLAVAVVAGTPHSPLTVPLPAGARPPGWATGLARALALDRIGRSALIAVSLVLVALIVTAFAGLAVEAWSGRVTLLAVAVGTVAAVAVSVAAPLLLSRDVFAYADAGRIAEVHHRDPYVVSLGSFSRDPFVRVTAGQWLRHHTVYGPAFTLLSEAIGRVWMGSPGAVILAFKALAGVGVAVAALCAGVASRAIRPERAAFAVAVVGLNPVVIVHTVGGGHVDAIVAALLAGALLVAVRAGPPSSAWAIGATICLALACLVKIVLVPVLALWLWQVVRSVDRRRRSRLVLAHFLVLVGVAAAMLIPFAHGWRTLTPLGAVGGLESWASPAHLVGHAVRLIAGSTAGRAANLVVVAAFLLGSVALFVRIGRRSQAAADAWGATLLLLVLSLPFLLPWYACWFVPFLGLMRDEFLVRIGVAVSIVLATTLVPADPFQGLTSPGVMGFVHYVVAPVLLVLFALAARRVWRDPPAAPGGRVQARARGQDRRLPVHRGRWAEDHSF